MAHTPTQKVKSFADQVGIAGIQQQFGRGWAAEDGAAVAGGEQIGQPADVVDASFSVVPAGKPGPSAKDGERAVDC